MFPGYFSILESILVEFQCIVLNRIHSILSESLGLFYLLGTLLSLGVNPRSTVQVSMLVFEHGLLPEPLFLFAMQWSYPENQSQYYLVDEGNW